MHHVGHLPRITTKVTFFVHIFQMEVESLAAEMSALAVIDTSDIIKTSNKLTRLEEQQVCGSNTCC